MKHSISYRNVSRETFQKNKELFNQKEQKLEEYLELLLWWNKKVNLISRDVPRETVREHLCHSILLSQLSVFKRHNQIIDAGTGGGLPGIPLAITSPEKQFVLNDIVKKKVLSVKQIAKSLKLDNIETRGGSIEEITLNRNSLLISKHAFKINTLLTMLNKASWSNLVFYKGLDFENELKEVNFTLSIEIFDLFSGTENEFYKDKGLIIVSKE